MVRATRPKKTTNRVRRYTRASMLKRIGTSPTYTLEFVHGIIGPQ